MCAFSICWGPGQAPTTRPTRRIYLHERVWGAEGASQLNGAVPIIIAASIQLQLTNLGLFLRGGMDVGPFFVSRQFMYGAPLACAHHIEEHLASSPRIVLSGRYADYARAQATEPHKGYPWEVYREFLAIDDDEQVFLNYLRIVSDEREDQEAWLRCHLEHLQSRRAHAKDAKVREKYEWVARYHDRFCRDYLGSDHPRLQDLLDDPSTHGGLRHLG